MADVVQWSIDQFWAELQNLENIAVGLKNSLNANKLRLQGLWSQTTRDPDAARRAKNQALLQPLIHQNSVLRVSYLAPIVAKFNQAGNAAAAALRSAGYRVPTLSGLGAAIIIAPVAAVTIVVAALALAYIADRMTHSLNTSTDAVARVIGDPTTSVAEKDRLLASIKAEQEAVAKNKPAGFDLGDVAPILLGVAAIMVLPTITRLIPSRRAA